MRPYPSEKLVSVTKLITSRAMETSVRMNLSLRRLRLRLAMLKMGMIRFLAWTLPPEPTLKNLGNMLPSKESAIMAATPTDTKSLNAITFEPG